MERLLTAIQSAGCEALRYEGSDGKNTGDVLVKASRLEIEMIRLESSNSRVTETLADAGEAVIRNSVGQL